LIDFKKLIDDATKRLALDCDEGPWRQPQRRFELGAALPNELLLKAVTELRYQLSKMDCYCNYTNSCSTCFGEKTLTEIRSALEGVK
jgi:hypothetical protein